VASVPSHSVLPGNQPPPSPQEAAIPFGAQMESPDPVADLTLCEGAQVLSWVGSEVILASEILPIANQSLVRLPDIEKASESDLAKAREQLIKRILPQHIELKLFYVDAKRNLPPEAIENIREQLGKRFEEVEVSERLKKLELGSRRELEEKLAEWGTSLEHEKQAFIEKAIAQQWIFEKLRKEEEVTHEQLLDYYQAHATEYDHPTRVRWEHLEVTFKKHPDKREAWQLIAMMGNAVQQGQPFDQVAKERSEGVMASKGGQRDWLTQGSLKSEVLDQSLFSLPAGTLSPIIEDETGFHIIRVVEREDAYRTPFEEIQGDIREKIKGERKQERLEEFVTQLREEIPVTTVFDQQTADSSTRGGSTGRRF
jgi:parvulin-like peptidyl-prolyl isomerase